MRSSKWFDGSDAAISLDRFDANGNPVPKVPITDFELKVEQVVKDDGAIVSGKPIILRMGGDATPEMKQITANGEYPFSFTGDRHLFLLSRNPDGVTTVSTTACGAAC